MKIAVTSKSFSKNIVLIEALKKCFKDVKLNYATKKLNDEELIDFLEDCDGAIVALEEINKSVLDSLPKLKAISKFGVGLDNIDLDYCRKKDIKIGWIGGVNKQSVAEMALGFMLMLIRNLHITSNKLSQSIWDKNGGFSLYGKTIGIIGIGHIGKELIKLLKPFECKILVNDIINQDEYYKSNDLVESSKEDIFKNSDIVTLHTPLNNATKYLINKDTLKLMKKQSFVLNTARGDLVNLSDLKVALKNSLIAGAAIDVYDSEPPKDSELLAMHNLICTPHIGGNSSEAVIAMGMSAIDTLVEKYEGLMDMAIIGNIFKLQKQLVDKNLDIIFEYFAEALNENSATHKRIFNLAVGSFEKVYISDDVFALEQVFYTKDREECFIESHKEYIDFQLILEGVEQMEYIDIDKLEVNTEYDKMKDLITYKLTGNTSKFLLETQDLAIFFPDDAHIGLPKYKESTLVYKTVIKLPAKLFI